MDAIAPAAPHRFSSSSGLAIIIGGGTAGCLDLAYAFVYHGLHGIAPLRILQSIASGLMGVRAFDSGVASAAFGLIAHFAILLFASALYQVTSRRVRVLVLRPLLSGIAFGACIYMVMHAIVLPLSAAPHFKTTPPQIALDIAAHLLLIGPCIAFATHRYASARRVH